MRSLPNILSIVKFPNFGDVSCFPVFLFFLFFLFFLGKKSKIGKEKLLDKNGPFRAVIIEELNFLNWDFFFPGFPEKHAGIIIEGGADLPFPPRFLKIG